MSKYTDGLEKALGIVNPIMLATHYQCPLILFNTGHAHAFGTHNHRVEVRFLRDGAPWASKPIRLRGMGDLKESRAAHLEAAIAWAEKRGLGVEEWVPSGFPNSWIPKDVKDKLTADIKAWRKAQSTPSA